MRIAPLRELPLAVARCAFLALLVAGVALHGGTQAATQYWLEWALVGVTAAYLAGRAISAGPLRANGWLVLAAMLLAALGWLSATQPKSVFDGSWGVFLPTDSSPWWPWGTVDGDTSIATMRRVTGMLGALVMASDLGSHHVWRRTTLTLMAWIGVAEAAFGLVHHLSGDVGNYWGTVGTQKFRNTVFGVFWYHGNAGALLNLCWPLLAAQTWREFSLRPGDAPLQQLRRAIHVLGLLTIVGAMWVNHSRAAQAMFVLQVAAGVVILIVGSRGLGEMIQANWGKIIIGAMASIAALAAVVSRFGADMTFQKWDRLTHGGLFADGRWAVYLTCRPWFSEVPALGFGPGTFAKVFYAKTASMREAPAGFWEFAHNDYLQTYFEWGWLGLMLWTVTGGLVLAAMFVALLKAVRTQNLPLQAGLLSISLGLLSVALHAVVDFPLQIFALQLYAATLGGIGVAMVAQSDGKTKLGGMNERKRHTREVREA